MEHAIFDKRKYPVVEVREGYAEWVRTYDGTVPYELDLRLFERLQSVEWAAQQAILDLACGTGRIGVWLKSRTPAALDGVDFTPEMLTAARGRGVYRSLHVADVTRTGLPAAAYDLCTQSLADEHLPELAPLYREVARVTRPGGRFVLVGLHPQFFMTCGIPTHFERANGESVAVRTHVHLLSEHVKAGRALGWSLLQFEEGVIDQAWLRRKPKWQAYLGVPVSFAMVWLVNPQTAPVGAQRA